MIVKEVKLMALSRGIRVHQYLDNWLIRVPSRREALSNKKTIVNLTESLGWIISGERSELTSTQVFILKNPTKDRWQKLQDLILKIKSKYALTVRCLMWLMGLLASIMFVFVLIKTNLV